MTEDTPGGRAQPSNLRAIETAQFRSRLAETAKQPEFLRANMMMVHLSHILLCPYVTREECFVAVYGAAGARRFWAIECCEPISWSRFHSLFAVLLADRHADLQMKELALTSSMLAAYQDCPTIFVGDTAAIANTSYGWQVKSDKLKVDVRQAAEWLLSKPKRKHLVPESLAAFIEGRPSGEVALSAGAARTGPKPDKLKKTTKMMLDDLRLGQITPLELQTIVQKILADRYGVSRDTMAKARELALREFAAVPNSGK